MDYHSETYRAEYAKYGYSKCRTCEKEIAKGDLRLGKITKSWRFVGMHSEWHHLNCFFYEDVPRIEVGLVENFDWLRWEDQVELSNTIAEERKERVDEEDESDEPDTKRPRLEAGDDPAEEAEKERRKQQNQKMFYYRDLLEEHCKKTDLYSLLRHNNQAVPQGVEEALNRLCDMMTFGALPPCPECGGGSLVYQSGAGYRCSSVTTKIEEDPRFPLPRWIRPVKITKKSRVLVLNPRREKFKVPKLFKKRLNFLKVYKSKLGTRIIPSIPGLPEIQPSVVAFEYNTVPMPGMDLPRAFKTYFFPLRRESVLANLVGNEEEVDSAESDSDSADSDEEKDAEEDSRKKDLKRSRKNNKYYTNEEDFVILKFIEANQLFKDVKGKKGWQDIEGKNILEGRTWQSMKERFRKVMMKRIQSYGLSEETVKKFRGLNPTFYTEEEDRDVLKYIEENHLYKDLKGNKVWQDIEEKNILEGRTWQSMKERFRKVMMKRIQSYGLSKKTVKKLRGLN